MRVSREPKSSVRDEERSAWLHDFDRRLDYTLWSRFGMRDEHLFRQSIAELLEQRFGVGVERRTIAGEQFGVVIHDQQHILVEIADSVGRSIQTLLERKCWLYEKCIGVRPAHVILATTWIHSARAHQLRLAGIEVIEPDEPDDPTD